MSVVTSVSLTNGTITTAIERVAYICIGIILALLADKLIFNKKLEYAASLYKNMSLSLFCQDGILNM